LPDWCFIALSAQIGYIVSLTYEIYCIGPGTKDTIKQLTKLTQKTQRWSLWR